MRTVLAGWTSLRAPIALASVSRAVGSTEHSLSADAQQTCCRRASTRLEMSGDATATCSS
ncbi:MAG TPA: hypothetical protein VG125_05230 [Pirellulales bacterium]|nr:hypothetical protein [Pirellulales bacterium]